MKRTTYYVMLFLTVLFSISLQAQHVEAYNDTVCDNEQYGVIRTNINSFLTGSYVVESIPPHYDSDFTNAQDILQGGTPLSIDDEYSDVIPIGFPFSFYGETYNEVVVGSNGDIIFEGSIAGQYDDWSISASQLIPDITLPYYNFSTGESYSAIYGAYHDIHAGIRIQGVSEMKYELRGTAPNRQFIITYHEIPQFSCTTLLTSQQITLYEGTNIIDVQIKHKPVCNTWNGGRAVIGVQNADASCYAYPGDNSTPSSNVNRNTGAWDIDSLTNPEGWRFRPAGQVSITWYDSNRNVVPGATADSLVVPLDGDLGPYTVEVTFTDCHGLTVTEYDEAQVVVVPVPQVDLGDDIFFCNNEEVTLDATPQNIDQFNTPPQYQWYKDGQPIQGATNPTYTTSEPGTYSVEVSSGDCSMMDEINVEHYVNAACVMPEAITPNGDGKNDSFVLDFLDGKYGIDKIEIFNRWGSKVFEKSNGYKDEWHGQNMNGKELPAAAYFYVVQLNDGSKKTGWVFIIK